MASERLGMNPERVTQQAGIIRSRSMQLGSIADEIAQTGQASRLPGLFGLMPGNLVITQGSIWLAEAAAADIRSAAASAQELVARLLAEVLDQRDTSSSGDGYREGISRAQAERLYERVKNDPGALDHLSPVQVSMWWNRLSESQQDELVADHHWLVGNTNGIPFDRRVEANRISARTLLTDTDLSDEQRGYLERVEQGNVTLVSFDPANDRIIEMIGEITPDTRNIVNFVPGTTADMDGFYRGETQELGHAISDGTKPPGSTVVFVYKDSPFPTFDLLSGVHNNSWAAQVGDPYSEFNSALRLENSAGIPVTSIEHSFGSSAGGHAESRGAVFDNRIVLGGIGMTDGWTPNKTTDYYSFTGPDDAIRLARGVTVGDDLGYSVPPTAANGFVELSTGFEDVAAPRNAWETPGYLGEAVDQHSRVAGVDDNQVTIGQIVEILELKR